MARGEMVGDALPTRSPVSDCVGAAFAGLGGGRLATTARSWCTHPDGAQYSSACVLSLKCAAHGGRPCARAPQHPHQRAETHGRDAQSTAGLI
eukprot:scaffold81259_cov70-Phaeocystis_antarctica.AAC.3